LLAPGITSLLDVTVTGGRVGDIAAAALANSTRFIELDAFTWTNNTVRVMARNISPGATFDLAAATLSVAVTKRRIP
jgi:triphosphoribosyl-dephospho-CoA synthetase